MAEQEVVKAEGMQNQLEKDNDRLLDYLLRWEEEYAKYKNVSGVGKHSEVKNEMSEYIKQQMDLGYGLEIIMKLTDDNLDELDGYPDKVAVADDFKAVVFKYVTAEGGSKDSCIRLPQLNAMPTLESGGFKLVLTPEFVTSLEFVKPK